MRVCTSATLTGPSLFRSSVAAMIPKASLRKSCTSAILGEGSPDRSHEGIAWAMLIANADLEGHFGGPLATGSMFTTPL